jgi:lysophospholipase L1-like esterase
LNEYRQNIIKIIQLCQDNHIDVVLVQPPFDADHMPKAGLNEFHIRYSKAFFIKTAQVYNQVMQTVADKAHVNVLNHYLDLRQLHQPTLFFDALHPTAQGNARMANDIYQQL